MVYFKKISSDLVIGFDIVNMLEGNIAKKHNFKYYGS